jgi:hypothetical protein
VCASCNSLPSSDQGGQREAKTNLLLDLLSSPKLVKKLANSTGSQYYLRIVSKG